MEFPKRPKALANVQANIDPELADAVRAACAAHGLTFKAAMEYGLKAFLEHAARETRAASKRRA